MKTLTKILWVLFSLSSSLMASTKLEIGNDLVVETAGGIYVVIDGELNESGTGYFKGKISSGNRSGMTSFAGMTLSTAIDGSITRTTGSGYEKGNGEGENFLRYYEVNNTSGSVVLTDIQISFISSGNFDERNSLADPYYIYRYSTNWNGYGEGASASPLTASGIHILSGLTDLVISDNSFIMFTDSEVATTGTPISFNEPGEGGDGHDVEMTFSNLTGSGDVTVQQTNRAPSDLPNNKTLMYFWNISKDAGITAFATDVSFKYLDGDLLDVTESFLVPAYYDDAQSVWSILQDYTLDELNNTITIHNLDHFTVFAIGEPEAFISRVSLSVKIYLEGPYDAAGDTMKTDLRDNDFVPTTSPFAEDPRTVSSPIPPDITDWVLVQLRETAAGAAVTSKSAFLRKDGQIVADDGATPSITMDVGINWYYVVIKHRNHLAVMSVDSVQLSSSSSTLYDFTTGIGQYYGTGGAKEIESGIWGAWSGDIDQSRTVDANDRASAWNDRNKTGYFDSDCKLSGTVDANSRAITWNNRNKITTVP